MKILSLVSVLVLVCTSSQASVLFEQSQRYTSDVRYDVYRNDKPVGEYSLRFTTATDSRVSVEVDMQINTKVFGLFSYDYRYIASETWVSDELDSLSVKIVTNGDEQQVSATREGQQLTVTAPDGQVIDVPSSILTTHHWFNSILKQSEVLNTISGEVSQISVTAESQARWNIDGRSVAVTGYRLGADLENTLSWYDDEGRWRGMTFGARDGSTIAVRWRGASVESS